MERLIYSALDILFIYTFFKSKKSEGPRSFHVALAILIIMFTFAAVKAPNIFKLGGNIFNNKAEVELRREIEKANERILNLIDLAKTFAGHITYLMHNVPNDELIHHGLPHAQIDILRDDMYHNLSIVGLSENEIKEAIKSEDIFIIQGYCVYILNGTHKYKEIKDLYAAYDLLSPNHNDKNLPDKITQFLIENDAYTPKAKDAISDLDFYIKNRWFRDLEVWKKRMEWDFREQILSLRGRPAKLGYPCVKHHQAAPSA